MIEKRRIETTAMRHGPKHAIDNAVVVRLPKPNLQIIVLGLIAIITLFQTFQLINISSKATSAAVKVISPATNTNSGTSGTGSDADVPQSMVGGC